MDEISSDELIGNLQTYEFWKNLQVKKDNDLALKALESESSDLDDEEIAMVAHRVTNLLKKVGWQLKKGSSSKVRNSDCDKPSECFRCGKHDHVVKNCPLQNEDRGQNSSETMLRGRNKISPRSISLSR